MIGPERNDCDLIMCDKNHLGSNRAPLVLPIEILRVGLLQTLHEFTKTIRRQWHMVRYQTECVNRATVLSVVVG